MEQLQQKVEAKDRVIAAEDQALAAAEAIIRQLEEALRPERIHKVRRQSEKLTDLQLNLLDHEPAVSGEEIESRAAVGSTSPSEDTLAMSFPARPIAPGAGRPHPCCLRRRSRMGRADSISH